jgi:hypothetical protein
MLLNMECGGNAAVMWSAAALPPLFLGGRQTKAAALPPHSTGFPAGIMQIFLSTGTAGSCGNHDGHKSLLLSAEKGVLTLIYGGT